MSILLDDSSHIWQTGKDVSDCGFPFKKSIIDHQIAEMASLKLHSAGIVFI